MDSGLYAAYTALLSRTNALDIAANNLANAGTTGFHAGRASFQGVMAEAQDAMTSQVGGAVNSYSLLVCSRVSDAQGALQPTGNPLDLAIEGNGFFAVSTANGTRYTRDGEFKLSTSGELQTKMGAAVLNQAGKPILVPSGSVKIGVDGTISVDSPDGSAVVGQVALLDLGTGGAVPAESAALYKTADGSTPGVAKDAAVQQGAVESANQNAVTGTIQLLAIQREAEMMQRALTTFHNNFDKTASEELARV